MCGIAGFYGFRNDELIKKISKELIHRGPDEEGFFFDDQATLLNRRLAIIDRATGNQPIYNEDKSIAVVFNGEIYNYQTIRDELLKKGHQFYTHSDTEVIVHGYEEWNNGIFDKLNGMFAIAIYDKKEKKMILCRDHFGIKPLYYSLIESKSDNIKLIFSSEIKPIINSGLLEKKANDRVIYRYLKFRVHDDQRETFFDHVYRLLPGELLIIRQNSFHIKRYTDLEDTLIRKKPASRLGQEMVDYFGKKLVESVKMRLLSEVPVGTCLSGGLDSSTIVAIVNKLLEKNVKEAKSIGRIQNSFSAVFPKETNNEEDYIDSLINKLDHIKSHKIYPKPDEFFDDMEDFVRTQEEPTISTGPYAQYKVMKEASRHVVVLLDGQGSDEMMAGYLPYYFVYLKQLFKEKKFLKLLAEFFTSIDIIGKQVVASLQQKLLPGRNINTDLLLNKEFIKVYRGEKFNTISDNLKKRLIEDIFRNSLQSLLRYEDRNSMRFSIEGRVPFLDHGLLRYLFSLPDEALINNGWNKNILRRAVKKLLPNIIAKRRNKIGFTTPEYEWFMKMKNRIFTIFMSESFAKRKYFNQREVLIAFHNFIEGRVKDTLIFWRLINLEMWLKIFFDKPQPKPIEEGRRKIIQPNPGKKLEIAVAGRKFLRYPIRTNVVQKDSDIREVVFNHVNQFFQKLKEEHKYNKYVKKDWFLTISEKIVAISQGRSYFLWEIKPNFWANLLSRFVRKTQYGIGLGSPWTMQLAIQEIGLPRILLASAASIVTKPFGIRGVFYELAGREAATIDGPTEYSLYPSNVSAKLGPKNPKRVAENIKQYLKENLPRPLSQTFKGVVIIDANDLGQNVLGNSTDLDNALIEKIFSDNPMGQAAEQTPLTIVF